MRRADTARMFPGINRRIPTNEIFRITLNTSQYGQWNLLYKNPILARVDGESNE